MEKYLSELENQKYDIRLSTIFRIGEALEMCPKNLIGCSCKK